MKKAVILLLALALAALGGCASRTLEVEVYRAVLPYYLSDGPAVRAETVHVDASLGDIDAVAEAFNSAPADPELANPLPDGVRIEGWELADGELRLSVSAGYASLSGYRRSAADCCLALSFCAVEGVERVSVSSCEALLTAAMSPEDICLADTSGGE